MQLLALVALPIPSAEALGFLLRLADTSHLLMHRLKIEVTKFTLVGAANFVVTFLVFTLLLKAMSVNYLLSLFAAWLVGLFFSYACRRQLSQGPRVRSLLPLCEEP